MRLANLLYAKKSYQIETKLEVTPSEYVRPGGKATLDGRLYVIDGISFSSHPYEVSLSLLEAI